MITLPDTPYLYDAEVVRCIDGDSVWLRLTKTVKIDFGFKIIDTQTKETVQNFRLTGINAPEIRGDQRQAGLVAKDQLQKFLDAAIALKVHTYKSGKYGRYLVTIYAEQPDGTYLNLNEEMIRSGHADKYLK